MDQPNQPAPMMPPAGAPHPGMMPGSMPGMPGPMEGAPAPMGTAAPLGAPVPPQVRRKKNVNNPYVWGTGRRKSAVARVRIKPGDGKFLINDRDVDAFFRIEKDRDSVRAPLRVTKTDRMFDVFVNVNGGGTTGQAGAIVLGLARALTSAEPGTEASLREHNMLTRDPREVERKKYGKAGARRSFQFSKR